MTHDAPTLDPSIDEMQAAVAVASGRATADLLLRNARVLNVFTGMIEPSDVAIAGRLIASVQPVASHGADTARVTARTTIDLQGAHLSPGLIDAHVHIESSLVTPARYAEVVLPRGVTGVVTDPHEIANVGGLDAVRWWLDASARLPLDVWVTAPSCVPSTPLETAGAELGVGEIDELLAHERVVGVAELMSFPDVIAGDAAQLAKVAVADHARKTTEGHAPSLTGAALQAYLAVGVGSDHESTTLEEGREKLAAGVYVMVREGSVTRDLDALMPLVNVVHGDRIGFCTDDRLPNDLLREGALDVLVRRAIAAGVDPTYAVRCGSFNTALHYRLPRRGAIAPGYFADLLVLADLHTFTVAQVIKHGRVVAEQGTLNTTGYALVKDAMAHADARPMAAALRSSVQLPAWVHDDWRIPVPASHAHAGARVRVLQPKPQQVVTESIEMQPTVVDGMVVADPTRDILKLACIHRHGRPHGKGMALGLVTGLGLQRGAFAASVGHDHHNLMVAGVDDVAMQRAALEVARLGGGFVVDDGTRVVAALPLPVAGLVSDAPVASVVADLEACDAALRALGAPGGEALMTLSFLGLAVIPELRLTDHGLVDVMRAQLVPLFV